MLSLTREERGDGRIELISAFEKVEFKDEKVAKESTTKFSNEGSGCGSGATWR